MRVDWWTLALQAANFLVLVWLLQHFLYRPVQTIIADRQQRAESVLTEADAARSAAESLRAELDGQRAEIDRERHRVLEEAHARAKQEAAASLEQARAEAEHLLVDGRRRLEQERAAVADDLRRDAIDLGVTIGRRLLTEVAETAVDRVFLDRAVARLQGLSESERAVLIDRLGHGHVVRVVTAAPLSPAVRDGLADQLRALLGADTGIEFAEDPDLLAGAELHFPHTVLHHSWQDSLRDIEEELKHDGRAAGHA